MVVVGGPTATGKTALAIEIALAVRAAGPPAAVLSADSRQVYRGLDVGTAKPALAERRGVPHHGLDLVEPDQPFSVADFVDHAAGVLAALAGAGGVVVLAGGTGFWIAAVAGGLAVERLPWDPTTRAALEADLARDGLPSLVARLRELTPGRAAEIDVRNPRRVVRALEIATLAGDAPLPEPRGYAGPVLRIGLDVADRALHRAWIARRAAAQLDGGILPEAEALRARFDPGLPAFSAIGYREAWDLLDGRLDRAGYLAVNVRRNVAFARRQRTWFRREPVDLVLDAADPTATRRAVAAALGLAHAWGGAREGGRHPARDDAPRSTASGGTIAAVPSGPSPLLAAAGRWAATREEDRAMGAFEVEQRVPRPAFAIRLHTAVEGIPALLSVALPEVWHAAEAIGLVPAGPPYTRYLSDFSGDFSDFSGDVEFEAGVPLPAPAPTGHGRAEPVELPGGSLAVGWHVGPYDTLGETYAALVRWIGEQGRAVAGPMWEVYWTDPRTEPDPARWRTEVIIPVT